MSEIIRYSQGSQGILLTPIVIILNNRRLGAFHSLVSSLTLQLFAAVTSTA
jgi:hypothetical protein